MTATVYHLTPIGILLLVSYLVSLLLVHAQFITRQEHRKFWNYLLLIFFVPAILLGMFLVVKVNYKLNIPWIEEVMQWHVDSGIGFSVLAIFHLSWHVRYYTKRLAQLSGSTRNADPDPGRVLSFTRLQERVFFLLLGFISILAQLVLLREFLKSFHGNELVIAVFLAVWMILTASGARIGSSNRVRITSRTVYILLVLLGLLPLLIHLLLILVNRFIFLPGYLPGLVDSVTIMVLLTGLFTMVSGFLFGSVSKSQGSILSGTSHYRHDAFGSLAGGVLFGLILVHLLDNSGSLTLIFLSTCLVVAGVYNFPGRKIYRWLLNLAGVILFVLSLIPGAGTHLEELRFRKEKILQYKDTPYGNLTITSRDQQVTGYLDGNPVLGSADLTRAEESIHFPALQHPQPESFLLLGGGLSGNIEEAAKYHPDRIDYCEADPWIFRLGKTYFAEKLPGALHFIPKDGRSWLKEASGIQYDVIVSAAEDPITIGWNRYFTLEFYQLVSQHLSPGGVFCMQMGAAGNYVNNRGIQLLGINYNTLKKVFPRVAIIPGSSTYFLASDSPLSLDFPSLLQLQQVPTTYVHPDYLDTNQILFDSDQLTGRILNEKPMINRDLRPTLFFYSLMGLESRIGQHSMLITGIIASLLFLLLWLLYPPTKSAMYITGFTGAGIQILLIMVMQSFYGYAYLVAPMMITLFMGGIVTGTLISGRVGNKPAMFHLTGLVGLMALISATGFLVLGNEALFSTGLSGQVILGVLNFMPGMVVGALFGIAVPLSGNTSRYSPGMLYSADLTGAALGTLLPVLFLFPLIGVVNTFILFSGINLAMALCLLLRGQHKRR
jgi:spermidine synthase